MHRVWQISRLKNLKQVSQKRKKMKRKKNANTFWQASEPSNTDSKTTISDTSFMKDTRFSVTFLKTSF